MFLFLLFTAFSVSFANSENIRPLKNTVVYSSKRPLFISNCKLKVEFDQSGVRFQAVGQSKTFFEGAWPNEAGEVDLYSSQENLKIQFHQDEYGVRPVSYIYYDLRAERNSPLTQPKVCFGIN